MAIDSKRVKDIFLEAAELSDEGARAAYLDQACGGNAGVRARVEALLRSHDPDGSFLSTPAAVVPDPESNRSEEATQALSGGPRPAVAAAQTTDGENGSADDEPLTFLAPPQRPDSLGRLGHYEVLQVLGRGAFGIVFRAFDEMLQRVVALKVLAPQLAATSPARKRFLREARSSAQVRHENVVQVYEVTEQPLPYLAMEFIPGETLQQKLDRVGPLDVPETLRIGRQIAEGLAAAHATDLIHRDIKPGNMLLEGGQHKLKITDFGLARAADDASISQSGIIAGTPMYMAPEQAEGKTLDQRADLFSLGSVMYQMVAGRPPFRANSTVAVLKRVAEDKPRPIREIIPETPQWLCDIIAKLHAKNPDDRYQSAREVADVLADCEAQLKANGKVNSPITSSEPKPPATVPPGRWKRVVAAIIVLAGLGVWFGSAWKPPLSDKGELEILPAEGLVGVIVIANEDGVLDGNKMRATVTDWLSMKQRQVLTLPPGRYQLNVSTWPEGTAVTWWEVTTSSQFVTTRHIVPVVQTSAIFTMERGKKVTLRPTMQQAAVPKGNASTKIPAFAPFADADVQRIAALPPSEQVEEVRKELMRHNPGFDGKMETKIEDGVVTLFKIVTDKVTDIAPIRVWNGLRVLECNGTHDGKPNGVLANLSPLKGMNLSNLMYLHIFNMPIDDEGLSQFEDCTALTRLNLRSTKVSDVGLAHFKNCKNLKHLALGRMKVSDAGLVHFKECKNINSLFLDNTQVSVAGLALFTGMRLTILRIHDTDITDLTPLQGTPLTEIHLTPKKITRGLEILRDMKSLKIIGIGNPNQTWPAAEFWERYDKGEFK